MEALAIKAVETFGKIDILVNNASASYKFVATSPLTSIKTIEWQNFDKQFQGTIRGAVHAIQAVLPHMETHDYGKIVNIGTVRFCCLLAALYPCGMKSCTAEQHTYRPIIHSHIFRYP